jgi:hypothetical protein
MKKFIIWVFGIILFIKIASSIQEYFSPSNSYYVGKYKVYKGLTALDSNMLMKEPSVYLDIKPNYTYVLKYSKTDSLCGSWDTYDTDWTIICFKTGFFQEIEYRSIDGYHSVNDGFIKEFDNKENITEFSGLTFKKIKEK